MSTIPDHLQIDSAAIEPAFVYLLSRWYVQAMHIKDTSGPQCGEYADALETLWKGVQHLNALCSCAPEARHAAIVTNNNIVNIARLIQEELHIDLISHPDYLPLRKFSFPKEM